MRTIHRTRNIALATLVANPRWPCWLVPMRAAGTLLLPLALSAVLLDVPRLAAVTALAILLGLLAECVWCPSLSPWCMATPRLGNVGFGPRQRLLMGSLIHHELGQHLVHAQRLVRVDHDLPDHGIFIRQASKHSQGQFTVRHLGPDGGKLAPEALGPGKVFREGLSRLHAQVGHLRLEL